eukprot:CAMPEP_0179458962 /NCGR_PEP_ID=MMETSP0799-20121207/42383_1 /TAXON_ID=46947 /ORGANISM="Geminigera cryophila, Strain CCMP2564" /LENGTH=443 /DNA_ID=CAMNT_0021260479 /DNA_START=42 /DNA_END=1373 /DNA_ORIENTATION=+
MPAAQQASKQQQKSTTMKQMSRILPQLPPQLRLRGGALPLDILGDIRKSLERPHANVAQVESSETHMGEEMVKIDMTKLDAFVKTLDLAKVMRASKVRFALPLVFDNFEEEVNFWALNSLLSFGSGWHQVCVVKHGQKDGLPHRDSVLHMLISMHMEGRKLDAQGISEVTVFPLATALSVPLTQEKSIEPDSPIRQDFPSEFRWFVDAVHHMMESVGTEMVSRGFRSLGDFILSTDLQAHSREAPGQQDTTQYTANNLVARLTNVFECLNDSENTADGVIVLHRRAQCIAEDLHSRFATQDARLSFPDVSLLSFGADSETCGAFVKLGFLLPSPSLVAKIEKGRILNAHSKEEVALRCASAKACLFISQKLFSQSEDSETVTCGHVWRYFDLLFKTEHQKKVRELEKEALENRDNPQKEEAKVSLIVDQDVPTSFVCKDTVHY